MANGANPWLSSAFQNTSNPNQDYQSYLQGLGMDVDPSQVGQFFTGIAEDYQQDVGIARAGFAQGMAGLRTQGQSQAMQLGGGQGLASIGGGGFGGQGYRMQQGLQGIGQQYGQGLQAGLLGYTGDLQSAQRGMESSFRDVATGLLARDSAGISWEGGDSGNNQEGMYGPPFSPGFAGTEEGQVQYNRGNNWVWQNGAWKMQISVSGGCFIAGTGIDTPDGIVPIEILEIGDMVKTYDLKNNKQKKSKVTETYKHNVDGYLIINDIIKTTIYHPFYSDGEWIKAGDLSIGDKILHVDGAEHKVSSIEILDDNVDVYNIEVDGTHNYFAEGYLVHNK